VYGTKKWKDHLRLYNHVKLSRAFSSDGRLNSVI